MTSDHDAEAAQIRRQAFVERSRPNFSGILRRGAPAIVHEVDQASRRAAVGLAGFAPRLVVAAIRL
jgi:hypothetical protein